MYILIDFYCLRLKNVDVCMYSEIYLFFNNNGYWDYNQDQCNQQESCEECGVFGLVLVFQGWVICIVNNVVVDIEEDQVRENFD